METDGDAVSFRDKSFGGDDLLTALVTFEAMRDTAGASDFLLAVPPSLRPRATAAVGEMLARGLPHHAVFAASLAAVLPGVPTADLVAALRRDDLPAGEQPRLAIAAQLGRELGARRGAYDPWLRTQAARAREYGWTLAPIYLLGDRAWALDHLDQVLGGGDFDASLGVRAALGGLDDAGKATLARELRARLAHLPAANRSAVAADLDDAGLP